ncbi:MAG: hypothetical protein RIN55_10715 [Tissierellaceae bacterium]|nr:hypothetical protein [Tissierellaceae bacterium]
MMIKIAHVKDTENLCLEKEIVSVIKEVADILDTEYGEDRDVDGGDGGYILVIQDKKEFSKLEEIYLDINDLLPEYVDKVHCRNGEVWISALVLMNNDFGVSLVMPIEIAPQYLIDEEY